MSRLLDWLGLNWFLTIAVYGSFVVGLVGGWVLRSWICFRVHGSEGDR